MEASAKETIRAVTFFSAEGQRRIVKDNYDENALLIAAKEGHPKVIKVLLKGRGES